MTLVKGHVVSEGVPPQEGATEMIYEGITTE